MVNLRFLTYRTNTRYSNFKKRIWHSKIRRSNLNLSNWFSKKVKAVLGMRVCWQFGKSLSSVHAVDKSVDLPVFDYLQNLVASRMREL